MRVIVDEGVSQTSPLWQQFQTWLGTDSAEGLWLADVYPSIPDVEILDKLLTPDNVLLTGMGSYTTVPCVKGAVLHAQCARDSSPQEAAA